MRKFLFITIISILILTSCSPAAAPTPTATQVPPTVTPTAAPTATPEPTSTPTIVPTKSLSLNNELGLIVTLGEENSGPWHPGIPVFSPDGQIIALANPNIRFWDVDTHELIMEIVYPFKEGCSFAESKFSPNSKYFAVSVTNCWDDEDKTGYLLVWNASTGELIQEWKQKYAEMPGPTGDEERDYNIPVYAFAFLPDSTGVVFASGNTLETRDLFDTEKQDILKLGQKMYASQISLSSDGRLAYIIMRWTKDHDWPIKWVHQQKFQVWNINTHAFLLEKKYPEGWVNLSLELLGTRLVLVDNENATSQITNLETNESQDIPFREGWRYYNADGSLMVYARIFGFDEDERAIELWKTDNWRNLYTFYPDFGEDWIYGMHEIAFSPDNTILAIEHQEQISLWNIRSVTQP